MTARKPFAVWRLAGFDTNRRLLAELLSLKQPPRVQQAALDALADFEDDRVAEIILKAWSGMSPGLQMRATEALLSRFNWITLFLDALENGRVRRGEVDASRLDLLKQSPDPQIAARVSRLTRDGSLPERQHVIQRYQAVLKLEGDPLRGTVTCFPSACRRVRLLADSSEIIPVSTRPSAVCTT